jgi:hypothetical protein
MIFFSNILRVSFDIRYKIWSLNILGKITASLLN